MNPCLLVCVVLLGVISTGDPQKSLAVFGNGDFKTGQQVDGYTVDSIDQGGVWLAKSGNRYRVRSGSFVEEASGSPVPAITAGLEVAGSEIRVTQQLRDFIAGEGLITILNQAAATPWRGSKGSIGYRVSDIDRGSVYDLIGLQDGDAVTEIDGVRLDSPLTALRALASVKGLDSFSFKFDRKGQLFERKVVIR